MRLCERFDRVMYVDLDVHHGDGVEKAFYYTEEVFTLSLHRYGPGFFPGSGSIRNLGAGDGVCRNLNIPFKEGVTDRQYLSVFQKVFKSICQRFRPRALVVQCGCDTLAQDPLGGRFNLTSKGIGACVMTVARENLPTLVLGGGGYYPSGTARCWTYITSLLARLKLNPQLPDHPSYVEHPPPFSLHTSPLSTRPNLNHKEHLAKVAADIKMFLLKMELRARRDGDEEHRACAAQSKRRQDKRAREMARKMNMTRSHNLVRPEAATREAGVNAPASVLDSSKPNLGSLQGMEGVGPSSALESGDGLHLEATISAQNHESCESAADRSVTGTNDERRHTIEAVGEELARKEKKAVGPHNAAGRAHVSGQQQGGGRTADQKGNESGRASFSWEFE